MMAQCKEIEGHPGYFVTDQGEVWTYWKKHSGNRKSVGELRQIAPIVGIGGYLHVHVNRRVRNIHHLVLETFVGPCPEGMCCRHLDGNPANNNLVNVCWGTYRENWEDKIVHGRDNVGHNHGESNGRCKLSEADVEEIKRLHRIGHGIARLGRMFGVNRNHVSFIIRGLKRRVKGR
jgi:hypothetical protein